MIFLLAPVVLLALAALVGRRDLPDGHQMDPGGLTRALASRWAPLAIGAVTTLAYWWAVGAVTPYPRIHDEASYILQAQTFAHLRWTNPPPPIAAFFEQYHVFVEPRFFSKYPPGHALLMVPGIWLGLPFLVPVLLHGVAGGFVFAIGRRLANPWVGLLAWVLWFGTAGNLEFRPTYFSEATSSACWLLGWWALLEWRATRRTRWLLVVAAATGWMAITRPLTAAAYAVPVGVVCLWDIVRGRHWRDAALAFALGTAIVAIMPLWSYETIGQVRPTPYSLYSDIYFPYDKPGFGLDTTPAKRPLNWDMQRYQMGMKTTHVDYTPERLPVVWWMRTNRVWDESLRPSPTVLTVLAVVGLVAAGGAGVFAVASLVAMTIAYLAFAHAPWWTLYYLEVEVVPPLLAALGAGAVVALVRARRWRPTREWLAPAPAGVGLAMLLLVLPATLEVLRFMPRVQATHVFRQEYFGRIHRTVDKLPGARKIVFVRYAENHDVHNSLVTNDADLATSPTWWVYDRGPEENARLAALAPDRVPYVLDEAYGWVGPPNHAQPWEVPPDLQPPGGTATAQR